MSARTTAPSLLASLKPPTVQTAAATSSAAAAAAPDLQTLTSWEDAFATYPLPGIRRLETQLRAQIADHRAHLRSLVGAHYRDLLSTADRIVDMHGRSLRAERILSDAGARCNASALERGVRNAGKRAGESVGEAEKRIVAEKVLRAAITGCARIVRAEGDGSKAAKMVVLARLLINSLDEEGEGLKRRLGRVREGLLEYISRKLGTVNMGREDTVGALCAYAMITSSAPGDVLRFFLRVRLQHIEALTETPSEDQLLKLLEIYRQTLLDVKDVFPRRFAEGLEELSKTALVKDKQMREAAELSLDIYEQWIAEDVRNFTPWFRHDQLSTSEVATGLASWAKKAQESLLQGLKGALKEVTDVSKTLQVRHKVLSNFLSLSTKVRDQGHSQAIDQIRLIFLARLEDLARAVTDCESLPLGFQPNEQFENMWELARKPIDLDNGAQRFRQTILQHQNGRDRPTQQVILVLDEWLSRLDRFRGQISSVSAMKWEDDIDIDLDELDDGDAIQMSLTKSDPQRLLTVFRESTASSLQKSYGQIEEQSRTGTDAAFLIRVLREVNRRRDSVIDNLEMANVRAGDGLVESLHQRIAESAVNDALKQYIEVLQRRTPVVTTLWDGTPPLPIHSSPGLFRFLANLHRAMSNAGNDLWSPGAVAVLQHIVASKLQDRLGEVAADDEDTVLSEHGNDDAEPGEVSARELRRQRVLQRLFDVLYLQRVITFGDVETTTEKLSEVARQLTEELKSNESVAERLKKNAHDYWRKTQLLFGLLTTAQRS